MAISYNQVPEMQINLLQLYPFTSAPVNAVNATGVLTFSGTTADGETVIIGSDIYQFKTSGNADAGKIKVDISGGNTAAASATTLISAITGNASAIYTATSGGSGIVNLSAKTAGVVGNTIVTTETCANGSFGAGTLTSGIDGTIVAKAGFFGIDSNYIYYSINANTTSGKNLRRIALGSAF